jgi:hypothetical protein
MTTRFFVIDAEGNPSWSVKNEAPEHFKNQAAARKRAEEMAESEPGSPVYVAQAIETVKCEVSPPKRTSLR